MLIRRTTIDRFHTLRERTLRSIANESSQLTNQPNYSLLQDREIQIDQHLLRAACAQAMALPETADTVEVHYVVFHPDETVALRGQMEVPRSEIYLDDDADGGYGIVVHDGVEWTIVHYGDPARTGGEEWYEVERLLDGDGEEDDSEWGDDEVTVFRFTIYNSDGSVYSVDDQELPPWFLTDNADPERMVWDGLEYTLEEACGPPGDEWFFLGHTLPEADREESEVRPGPAAAEEPPALSATLVTYDADGYQESTVMVRLPPDAIVPNASGLGTLTHDRAEYTVVHLVDEPGTLWCEAHRVLPAPAEQDVEMITVDLTTHYDDGWVDEERIVVPGTAVFLRAGDLRIEHDGQEYTFQHIYEAREGGVYTAWRDGGVLHPEAAEAPNAGPGLATIPEEAVVE